MKHFIITRFFSYPFGRSKEEMLSFLDDKRLEDGFEILKKHFIKTIENQINRNFEIIILIYDNLPMSSVEFLNEIKCDNKITILHMKDLDEYVNGVSDGDIVITTRLDYDDFIHKNCVDDVQKIAANTECMKLYGLNNGCSMADDEICYYHHPNYVNVCGFFSCFETLIVNTSVYKSPITIYTLGEHSHVFKEIKNFNKNVKIEIDKDKKQNISGIDTTVLKVLLKAVKFISVMLL